MLLRRDVEFWLSCVCRMPALQLKEDNGNYMCIDSGVRNLAAAVYSDGSAPTLYDGNKIRSYNQYCSKKTGSGQSDNSKKSERIFRIPDRWSGYLKRETTVSVTLYTRCQETWLKRRLINVNTIVIGCNSKRKQKPDLGGKNSQNFCLIPHHRLIAMIKYKAEEKGINVICHEESYT